MGELMTVELEQIHEPKEALRTVRRDQPEFAELIESVKERGIINPISVRRVEDALVLVDGLHRYSAAVEAGLTEIPVNVLDVKEADALIVQMEGNLHRIETKPGEYTRHLHKILGANPGMTLEDLAKRCHKSASWVKERLMLINLIPRALTQLDEGTLPLSNAYVLGRLPDEEQEVWIDRATTTPPDQFMPECLARIKELRAAAKGKPSPVELAFKMRKKGDVKDELDRAKKKLKKAKGDDKHFTQGYVDALKWTLQVDDASLKAAQEEREKREQELAARKAEKAKKKAAKAAEAAKAAKAEAEAAEAASS